MNSFSYRFAELRVWSVLILLMLILALLGGMIWRNFDRFETMRAYVIYAHRIQKVGTDIQEALTDLFVFHNKKFNRPELSKLFDEFRDLANHDNHAATDTPKRLDDLGNIFHALSNANSTSEQQEAFLVQALNTTSAMMDAENLKREKLMEDIGQSTRTEVVLVFATVFLLLLVVGFFLKFRILNPLHDLKKLLLRLAREDFSPIDADRIDPLLLPVFNSYNVMVIHLAELEEAKRHYAASLEHEVRAATRALLEQQADLARNERLAAVGELAAGIAHELRNPLAGIQMSCANLRREIADEDQSVRVAIIIEELKRMGRLLNELLDLSKHTPAPVNEFDLVVMIKELIGLTRYQIPQVIELSYDGPSHLFCLLPEGRLRQSILNLILNSAQALGERTGFIAIRVSVAADGTWSITISDNGPGFSKEILHSGIRPFVTGKPGGTGLGLAMVQRFVRELGGQFSLSSNAFKGATVTLVLPIISH